MASRRPMTNWNGRLSILVTPEGDERYMQLDIQDKDKIQ